MVGEFFNRIYSIATYHFPSQSIDFPSLFFYLLQYHFGTNIVLNFLLFSLLVPGTIKKILFQTQRPFFF